MKKFLISALVVAMCLGMGATAFAVTAGKAVIQPAGFSDIAGHETEGELTLLGAMGVFTGDSGLGGAVKPDDPITRAQFCKVLVTAIGRGSTAAGLAGLQPTFTDGGSIPPYAWGSVNVAVYMGIINGYADGSFGPNNPVTYAEAVTMLIRGISGHAAQVGVGLWPYNFLFYGVDNGFTGAVDVGFANLPCTRGDMAGMLVATLQINKLNAKAEEQLDTAVLTDREYDSTPEGTATWVHAGNLFQGTFLGFNPATAVVTIDYSLDRDVVLGDKVWMVGATSYSGLVNLPVFVVKKTDGGYFIWVTGASNTISGVFDVVVEPTSTDLNHYLKLKDGTKVPYSDTAGYSVYLNKAFGGTLTTLDEVVITLDEDGLAANVDIMRVNDTGYILNDITKSVKTPEADTKIDVEENTGGAEHTALAIPKTANVLVNSTTADRDTLAEFDFVQIYRLNADHAAAVVEVRVVRTAVEGTVKGSATTYPGPAYSVTIDTKTYAWTTTCLGTTLPTAGKVKYGLDQKGQLFVPIMYSDDTPYVLLRGWANSPNPTGSPPAASLDQLTVDLRGVDTTYTTDGDDYAEDKFASPQDCFGKLTITGASGLVTAFDPAVAEVTGGDFEVVAVDATTKTLTLKSGTNYYFFASSSVVVYDKNQTTGEYAYVGWSVPLHTMLHAYGYDLADADATVDIDEAGECVIFVDGHTH